MSMLESKKYNLIEWIISIADERILDGLQSVRNKFEVSKSTHNDAELSYKASTYSEIKSRKVDLEQLKKEQSYASTSSEELSEIAKEAAIEESIDHLLAELKEMG